MIARCIPSHYDSEQLLSAAPAKDTGSWPKHGSVSHDIRFKICAALLMICANQSLNSIPDPGDGHVASDSMCYGTTTQVVC
jgi:hypothetical protein